MAEIDPEDKSRADSIFGEVINQEYGKGAYERMKFRADYCEQTLAVALASADSEGWRRWIYLDEGDVALVRLTLPRDFLDLLTKLANAEGENCPRCQKLELCEGAGVKGNTIRVVLTELLKLGFANPAALRNDPMR